MISYRRAWFGIDLLAESSSNRVTSGAYTWLAVESCYTIPPGNTRDIRRLTNACAGTFIHTPQPQRSLGLIKRLYFVLTTQTDGSAGCRAGVATQIPV